MAKGAFQDQSHNYKPEGEPVTPYQKAAAEWDDRIGTYRVQAKNWRIFALGSMAVSVILAAGLVYKASKSSVTPYVVQTTSDGLVVAVGPAKASNYTPQAPEIKHFLSEIVNKSRSIPLDPVVSKQNWIDVYDFLRPQGQNEMNVIAQQENPMSKIGQITRTVIIIGVIPQSKDTWQVRWKEDVVNKGGEIVESYKMTGLFTIDFQPPTNEKQLLKNPLGLFVRHFSWSKDVTAE